MSVIKCGSYTGNGTATGPVINLGWKPQWVLIKRTDSTGGVWFIYDNLRDTSNPRNVVLTADSSGAESSGSSFDIDFNSTGFQIKTTLATLNNAGNNYIYVAIRDEGV